MKTYDDHNPSISSQLNHYKFQITAALIALCLVAAGTFSFAANAAATGDNFILVSHAANRSQAVALNGQTVSGNIYVFIPPTNVRSTAYFLDTNGNFHNNVMTSGKGGAPFDFAYTQKDGTARPFNTKTLKDGTHTLVITVQDATTGKYARHTSVFIVNNTGGGNQTPSTTVAPPTTAAPTTTTTVKPVPTTTAPPTTTTTRPAAFVPAFAGDVSPGNVRWGAAISGNADPVSRHETIAGKAMGIHRTYFQWANLGATGSLMKSSQTDIAAGRVPWVSVKPPAAPAGYTSAWQAIGDGVFDANIKATFTQLSGLNGPVWFSFAPEPEGGCGTSCAANGTDDAGGSVQWIRAQQRFATILHQLRSTGVATNVAFASNLMGWTFQTQSGRNPSDWFAPGVWDFASVDVYTEKDTVTDLETSNGFDIARKFYGDRGLKIAIGEWGNRTQSDADRDAGVPTTAAQETAVAKDMLNFYNDALASAHDGKGSQVIGMAYFDSNLNSATGGWELKGGALDEFRALMKLPTSLLENQN